MNLKAIKKHETMPTESYKDSIGILSESGGLSFGTRPCKEEIYHAIGKAIGFNYSGNIQANAMGPSVFTHHIDAENPGIVFYLNPETKFNKARRINKVVKLLNDKLEIEKDIEVYLYEDSNSVLIRFDKWYYRNAVSVSALLTFIRAAANSVFSFKTLDEFVNKAKVIKIGMVTKKSAGQDSPHFSKILENKNLENFLNKSLPIMKRENAWQHGRKSDIPYDGIVEYNTAEYDYTDISDGIDDDDEDDYDEDYYRCTCDACNAY